MASTGMYRVQQVATGVAGAPYYFTGYFDAQAGTATQAATAWRNFLGPDAASWGAPYRFEPITNVDVVDPATGDITLQFPVAVAGLTFTATGEPLPPATAMGINWRTGIFRNGRQIKGRTFLSRFSETSNDLGVPSSTVQTLWQTRIDALIATANADFVIWSKAAGQWYPATSGQPAAKWYVLRSRRD